MTPEIDHVQLRQYALSLVASYTHLRQMKHRCCTEGLEQTHLESAEQLYLQDMATFRQALEPTGLTGVQVEANTGEKFTVFLPLRRHGMPVIIQHLDVPESAIRDYYQQFTGPPKLPNSN